MASASVVTMDSTEVVLRTRTPDGVGVILRALVYAKILEEHPAVADVDLIDRTVREPDERRPDPRPGGERFFRREGDLWARTPSCWPAWSSSSCAPWRARSASACSAARSGSASPPRSWHRPGSASRCCSRTACRASRCWATPLGAEALSGGSVGASLLAALAVGGWVFIGFDACVGVSEETRNAARHVPRAIWLALLSVAALVILNAVATTLAHPDPAAIVAGRDADPMQTTVVASFGSWSDKPFAAVVLAAFLACGTAAQSLAARTMYSIARDDVLPGGRVLRHVDHRGSPLGAIATTAVVACLGLLVGLNSAAVGTLIAFGTASIYVAFLLVAVAALVARVRGTWVPAGGLRLGRRAGLAINVAAVAWLGFETINIAWPRASLAPPGAPIYQVWAAPVLLTAITVIGLVYLAVVRPHRRLVAK